MLHFPYAKVLARMQIPTFLESIEFLGVECGDVVFNLSPHLNVEVISRKVGGVARFTCDNGFDVRGPNETVCQSSGDWANPFPTCEGKIARSSKLLNVS